jgi:signal transduction histidine kinase
MRVGIQCNNTPVERTDEGKRDDFSKSLSTSMDFQTTAFTHRHVSLHIQNLSKTSTAKGLKKSKQISFSPVPPSLQSNSDTVQPNYYSSPITSLRRPSYSTKDIETATHRNPDINQLSKLSSEIPNLLKSTRHNDLHNIFLGFSTSEFQTKAVAQEYRQFKRSGFNVSLTILVVILWIILIFFVYFGTNQGTYLVREEKPFVFTGTIFAFIALFCVSFAIFNRAVMLSYDHKIVYLQKYFEAIIKLTDSPYSQCIEDCALIFLALSTSLFMMGMTTNNLACKTVNNLDSFHCHEISNITEQMMSIFLGILLGQVFMKGASRTALCISWMISIIFTNLAISMLHNTKMYSINLSFIFIIIISYEFERSAISLFLEKKVMLNAEVEKIAAMSASAEIRLERDVANSISLELQGTISNSAHDMRSPCTALSLGIESLLKTMVSHHLKNPSAENNHNLILLRGMSQTLAFMGMSINRAMDFGKSAFGIELKPTIRPLNAMANIKQIVEFVSWDDPSISDTIRIAPIPHDFPAVGLTDISWFQENMICLITNAIKYSNVPTKISIKFKMSHHNRCNFAQFSVSDSGNELSDLALLKIFDPPLQVHFFFSIYQ